ELAFQGANRTGEAALGYADGLKRDVEKQFPGAALRARLQQVGVSPSKYPNGDVASFLARNPDFNFNAANFDAHLDEKAVRAEPLRSALKRAKRMLTYGPDDASTLLNAGYSSSRQIANGGRRTLRDALPEDVSSDRVDRITTISEQQNGALVAL